jgi:hypothetical protein
MIAIFMRSLTAQANTPALKFKLLRESPRHENPQQVFPARSHHLCPGWAQRLG